MSNRTPQPQQQQISVAQAIGQLQQHILHVNDGLQATRKKVYGLEARAALAEAGRKPKMPVQFRSQFGEDLIIWDLLGGQLDGFFIECGAFDGVHLSVTYVLEALGWKGLLVEGIPQRFEQCRTNRPNSRVVNAALSRRGSPPEATFTVTEDHYGGMLSYLTSSAAHKQAIAQANMKQTKVTVPCTTMNELLKDHTGPIDVAVIDVEGGEIDLLDGFDLHKWKPRVLLLEDNERGQDPALGNYMATQPYVQVAWVEINRVYVRADETGLIARAQGRG